MLWFSRYERRISIRSRRFLRGEGSLWPNISGRRERPPPTICARLERPVNALQLCRWKFSNKETLYQTFFEKRKAYFLYGKWKNRFWGPLWGLGQRTLFIIEKLVGDFLLVIIELFSLVLSFCHNPRVWQTDRRTDRMLIRIPRLHSCSAVKRGSCKKCTNK